MKKKLLSLLLALVMVVSIAALGAVGASAASTVTYSYDSATDTLTISGTGYLWSNDVKHLSTARTVIIHSGITGIGSNAFSNAKSLRTIILPSTLTEINDYAFEGCSELRNISIPDSVTHIGMGAFRKCSSLQEVNLPSSLLEIETSLFADCVSLNEIIIPDSVTGIGFWSFSGCTSLENISIPNSVTYIGVEAFSNCTSLKKVVLPSSVNMIWKEVFSGCNCLVDIPESVTEIYDNSFGNPPSTELKLKVVAGSYAHTWAKKYSIPYYCYLSTPKLTYQLKKGGIALNWDTVKNAQMYYIYRKTIGSKYQRIAEVSADTFSYYDSTIEKGVEYQYVIRAYRYVEKYDDIELSTASNSVIATVSPDNSIVVSSSINKVQLSWGKIGNVTEYIVYRSTSADYGFKKLASTGVKTTYMDKTVKEGSTYYYKVCAIVSNKVYWNSNIAKIKVTLPIPVISDSVKVTSKTVTISWNTVKGVSGYRIYKKVGSGEWKTLKNVFDANAVSYTDSNAKGVASYAVAAFKKVNGKYVFSSKSAEVKVRTLSKPKLTMNEETTDATYKIITLNGTAVSGATGYQVYQKKEKNGKWENYSGTIQKPTFTLTIDKTGTYYYAIRAICKSKTATSIGAFSSQVSVKFEYVEEPSLASFCTPTYDADASVNVFLLKNKGSQTVRVFSEGAYMSDKNYSIYDRDLELIEVDEANMTLHYLDYIDIAPGESVYVCFSVIGNDTWYDKYTKTFFYIEYCGIKYKCMVSNYYDGYYVRVS